MGRIVVVFATGIGLVGQMVLGMVQIGYWMMGRY